MTTTEDAANQASGAPRKRVRVNITGRVVLRRRDAAAFLDALAKDLAQASPFPVDFTEDVERLKGAVVRARPTALPPGAHGVEVRKNGKVQHYPSTVVAGMVDALVKKHDPGVGGRAVPERAEEILRAVLDKTGRWRDPKTGHFTLDPSAVR